MQNLQLIKYNMNKYKIIISGMHCVACRTLISIDLEDAGFKNIEVNLAEGFGIFESEKEKLELDLELKELFKQYDQYKLNKLEQL